MRVIRLRPAAVLPSEMYTRERIAKFERESAVDVDTRRAASEALNGARGGGARGRRSRPRKPSA